MRLAVAMSMIAFAASDSPDECAANLDHVQPSKAAMLLQVREDSGEVADVATVAGASQRREGGQATEESEIFGCRRRRRRRRRQDQTLNKQCWYQVYLNSMHEGGWMNYAMGNNLCDDLSAYNNGWYNNKLSSGLFGATPGCKLVVYEATTCSGTNWVVVDATSSSVAVTRNRDNLDDWSNKISSFYCTCTSSLLQDDHDADNTTGNATGGHHTDIGDPEDEGED